MTEDNVVSINKNEDKTTKAPKGKVNTNALEFQLFNMRQLYEGCVQEKTQLNQIIDELRTILGAMIVSTDGEEFTIEHENLVDLQNTYQGFEIQPNTNDSLTIYLVRSEDDE